jgi:hemerythrin
MDFMTWSDDYSVHIVQLDAQHKHLVGMINGLVEVMKRGCQDDELAALLEDLLDYTRYHFESEEKTMARANYPDLAEHRAKHAAMRAEVERLLAGARSGNTTTAMKLMAFLKNWLIKHINGTDKMYVPALQKAGIA